MKPDEKRALTDYIRRSPARVARWSPGKRRLFEQMTQEPKRCSQRCTFAGNRCPQCDAPGPREDGYLVTPDPFLCEHPNEVPGQCPCPPGCYCKTRSCAGRPVKPWEQSDECAECRVKPGAPYLCSECLRRRAERNQQEAQRETQKAPTPSRLYDFDE